MKEKLIRFMYGRYGVDQFSKFLMGLVMACLVVSIFVRTDANNVLVVLLLVYAYFRIFSKNHSKRQAENQKYLQFTAGVRRKWFATKQEMLQRKTHHIYRCPDCKQKIRIPKGKGKIAITCPKCRASFQKQS